MTEATLGPLEGIKSAIVSALRAGIDEDIPASDPLHKVINNVTLEYPLKKGEWPAMWVGFSIRKLAPIGINDSTFLNVVGDGSYKLWSFEGNASVTILALSNVERDRIADSFIRMFAFSEHHASQNDFWNALQTQPYILISTQRGELKPTGQSEGPGMAPPWDNNILGYSDSYSFDIMGQFASSIKTGALVRLSEVIISPTQSNQPNLGEWI